MGARVCCVPYRSILAGEILAVPYAFVSLLSFHRAMKLHVLPLGLMVGQCPHTGTGRPPQPGRLVRDANGTGTNGEGPAAAQTVPSNPNHPPERMLGTASFHLVFLGSSGVQPTDKESP